jgi:hypothetical protein
MPRLTIKDKQIGNVVDGTLHKTGKQVVLFRNYDGFAITADVPYPLLGVERVELTYEGKTYTAPISQFDAHGIRYKHPNYEAQVVLPRRFWIVRESNQTSLIKENN